MPRTFTPGATLDRVAYYAAQLATRLGYSPQDCEQIRVAGLFHDIGKLSIPDGILTKNDRLSEAEYEIVKAHPRNGADILRLSLRSALSSLPFSATTNEWTAQAIPTVLWEQTFPKMFGSSLWPTPLMP